MLIARLLYNGTIRYGIYEGDRYRLLHDTIFTAVETTGETAGEDDIMLLAPVQPPTVIGLGRNYFTHIEEMNVDPPEQPAIFFKPGRTIIGPLEPIVIPRWATRVDYEGELGVVIGTTMRSVPEDAVAEHIFGCTCFNDVTERHIGSLGLINQDISKCCDTFGPCGPFISTDVDPDDTRLRTYRNGELVQDDHTGGTVFSVAPILSRLSCFMTLKPGDLVITGTPGGIGPLAPGDTIAVEIDGIGTLTNPVVLAATPQEKKADI